ncbi:hypothetical protein GGQ88_000230 [Novosphingobium hassiacum]|uniref:Uncharacterized protein n=1 Tax=Novosphingobium hassiacum TaxID=173676 RepID=A0A7W5ZW52_9SPHN|nr:hypothetical protein [Novosphingobium hassiacum]MBB3858990.1 hypothetical protein [Novosphingobium hassiacum]
MEFWAIFLVASSFLVIAYGAIKINRLKSELLNINREVERLTAHSKILENNAAHSEKLFNNFKDNNKLSVAFFTEEISEGKYFSKSRKLRYKSQLYLNGIPIGAASTLKEDVYSVVDREKVDQVLENYALPLIEAGVAVAKLADGGKLGALGTISAKPARKAVR